jgi:hemerythrin-like domain-containing protein
VQKAIEVLMGEHRLIEQALGSLETFAFEVEAGREAERAAIADYAAFFEGFADTCHHGKEEEILFRRLIERGMPRESGPLAVMLHEHELGRRHVRGLSEIGAGPGAAGPQDAQLLIEHAAAFIPMLRAHILKEDRILYPMAGEILTASEQDAMEAEFEVFERRMRLDGTQDRLRGLADRLTGRFRPDPARMAEAAHLVPCGH